MQSLTPRQARGDPWEERGCCWVSCVCCKQSVSSQQPSFRGSVFKQESAITCPWYPNIVAQEEHLVSRPGTTYSEHCSLCFPRPPVPPGIPRLCNAETSPSKATLPACQLLTSQRVILSLSTPNSASPRFSLI